MPTDRSVFRDVANALEREAARRDRVQGSGAIVGHAELADFVRTIMTSGAYTVGGDLSVQGASWSGPEFVRIEQRGSGPQEMSASPRLERAANAWWASLQDRSIEPASPRPIAGESSVRQVAPREIRVTRLARTKTMFPVGEDD